ncbi:uncharacterized protein V1516DRAFT_679820 [Lipomyces oligophaga]|uniref:uncharacterized protein n=1 Tax=Lipomyces oligophaga TaxID=45792 RepID=UPI0034CECB47
MSSILSTLSTWAPYHLFTFGILFGSTVYQSFFVGIASFRALPRQHFAALQRKIFPPYFTMQTVAPLLLALTCPFGLKDTASMVLLGATSISGLVNLAIIGPKTVDLMIARKTQETKEGKKYYEEDVSQDMLDLNKKFGVMHGISAVVNLGTLFAISAYGVFLSAAITAGLQ